VHGVLDRAMKMLEIPRVSSRDTEDATGYYLKETNDPMYFPGRAARIIYRVPTQSEVEIGRIGVLHPTVLEKFEIGYPCSVLEFTLEPFRKGE